MHRVENGRYFLLRKVISGRYFFILLLALLFLFRLGYGLCSEFWFEDELQVYLIGLKFYTTGNFPFFGPDVVYTKSQIPGGLLGLLTGLPFFLLKIPEAPYILLNILSFSSLCILAKYLQKRFQGIPWWFIWIWPMVCPWTMNMSTHVLNPSYVLFGSVLFFMAFFESIPEISIGFIKKQTAFLVMGFSLCWIFQLHMSWVLLMPFIFFAGLKNLREVKTLAPMFLIGCLAGGSTLIPTYLTYGFGPGSGDMGSNIVFNMENVKQFITVLMRFLSFASNEFPRFMDTNGQPKLTFFSTYIFAAPFMLFAVLSGFVQVGYMIIAFFRKNSKSEWLYIKYIVLTAFVLTWFSFFFSIKGPSSHTFYIMFPLVMIYSMYVWESLFRKKWFVAFTTVMLLSVIITNTVLMYNNFHLKSMYLNRDLPEKAIKEKNYEWLGERRAWDRNS